MSYLGHTMNPMDEERVPEWTLGDRLRKARSLTGLDTRAFADLIGVSHGTITNAELNKTTVRRITIKAWSAATGVSEEWLEFGDRTTHAGPDDQGDPSRHSRSCDEAVAWVTRLTDLRLTA